MKKDNHYFGWGLTAVVSVCSILLFYDLVFRSSTRPGIFFGGERTIIFDRPKHAARGNAKNIPSCCMFQLVIKTVSRLPYMYFYIFLYERVALLVYNLYLLILFLYCLWSKDKFKKGD